MKRRSSISGPMTHAPSAAPVFLELAVVNAVDNHDIDPQAKMVVAVRIRPLSTNEKGINSLIALMSLC